MDCKVCMSGFTKTLRKSVECPYCQIQVCVECLKTYLLQSFQDPHCLDCKKGWSREFIDSNLPSTWIRNEYKNHREDILLDREKSQLPEAQIVVERQNRAKPYQTEAEKLSKTIRDLEIQLQQYRVISNLLVQNSINLKNGHQETQTVEEILTIYNYPSPGNPVITSRLKHEKEEHREFIMQCPVEDCRGLLSQVYKCGVCETYICPDCHIVKKERDDPDHICNQDTVKTVASIKKECRTCPKCAVNIYRIHGCNQMFCTACKTSFDWVTGKISTGPVHNPHYHDWLAQTGRTNTDVVNGIRCGGNVVELLEVARFVFHTIVVDQNILGENYKILKMDRFLNHLEYVEMPRFRVEVTHSENLDLNVQYLKKEVTQEEWKKTLQQREKRRYVKHEIYQRINAFVTAVRETLMELAPYTKNNNLSLKNIVKGGKEEELLVRRQEGLSIWEKKIQEIDTLIGLYNTSMESLKKCIKNNVYIILYLEEKKHFQSWEKPIKSFQYTLQSL